MRALLSWDRVGVLMDEGPHAVVTVLLKGDTVCLSFALLSFGDGERRRSREYNEGSVAPMELRCWQGHTMTGEQTRSLAELTIVWRESSGQRKDQDDSDWRAFLACCTALAESEIRLWWWPRYVRA